METHCTDNLGKTRQAFLTQHGTILPEETRAKNSSTDMYLAHAHIRANLKGCADCNLYSCLAVTAVVGNRSHIIQYYIKMLIKHQKEIRQK